MKVKSINGEVLNGYKWRGNSLVVWWLGLHASTAGGLGLIPGRGTKIPQDVRRGQQQKKYK